MDLFLYGFATWIDEGRTADGGPPNAVETSFRALGFMNSADGTPVPESGIGCSGRGKAERDSETNGSAVRRTDDFAKNSPGT
jgi:hypothetical protein